MLTEEEKRFLAYWEENRDRKNNLRGQLAAGLPLGVVLAAGIFIAYFSGWYKRAAMMIRLSASGVLVVLTGLVAIVLFVVVFSARHKREMNEQRYREIKSREGKSK